jgi:cellulose synthase/poly-beta-1,6-N-acetylglucosamine synthase-like glycosyltransferase
MNNSMPTVTIAVSAYNEEKNIKTWLTSVLTQQETGFKLQNILIHSDGSSDSTVAVANTFTDKRIIIFDHKQRVGKSTRLNQIYQNLDSDFLVQTDADIVFAHHNVIHDLIGPLISDDSVMMCGGNPLPVSGKTFVEKAVNISFGAYQPFRTKVRHGNNIFSADGRLLAYRNFFVKQITVPENMIANDAYTYFVCKSCLYNYRHVPSATVYFRSPQTLKDQIKQNTRFLAAPLRFKRLFSEKLVSEEYSIPKYLLWKNMFRQFIRYPIYSFYIFIVNQYCHIKARLIERQLNGKWAMAVTTKSLT